MGFGVGLGLGLGLELGLGARRTAGQRASEREPRRGQHGTAWGLGVRN